MVWGAAGTASPDGQGRIVWLCSHWGSLTSCPGATIKGFKAVREHPKEAAKVAKGLEEAI